MASNIQAGTRGLSASDWVRLKRLRGSRNYVNQFGQDTINPAPTLIETTQGARRVFTEFGTSKIRRPASSWVDYIAAQKADYVLESQNSETKSRSLDIKRVCDCIEKWVVGIDGSGIFILAPVSSLKVGSTVTFKGALGGTLIKDGTPYYITYSEDVYNNILTVITISLTPNGQIIDAQSDGVNMNNAYVPTSAVSHNGRCIKCIHDPIEVGSKVQGNTGPRSANVYADSVELLNVRTTCTGQTANLKITWIFDVPVTSITSDPVTSYEINIQDPTNVYGTITDYAMPTISSDTLTYNFTLNNGAYVASGTASVNAVGGSLLSTPQTYGAPPSTPPFTSGGSLFFTGASDGYVCAGTSSGFQIPAYTGQSGSGDFTVMWWQYLYSGNSFPRAFCLGPDTLAVSEEGGGSSKAIYVWINGQIVVSTGPLNVANSWAHFAVIRRNGTVRLYIDGTYIAFGGYTGAIGTSPQALILGQKYTRNNTGEAFAGAISKFVFDNGTARYIAPFTPPTADPSTSGTTKLLLLASDANSVSTDSSGNGNNLSFYGNNASNTPGFSPRA